MSIDDVPIGLSLQRYGPFRYTCNRLWIKPITDVDLPLSAVGSVLDTNVYTLHALSLFNLKTFLSSGLDSYVDSYKDRHFCRHNAFVACELALWYGVVNVDLYSAMITKVTNALNALVSGEEPGFQALSKGLVVLLCAEVVRQTVMLTRPQGSRPRPRPRP